jgi:hypothetical protein
VGPCSLAPRQRIVGGIEGVFSHLIGHAMAALHSIVHTPITLLLRIFLQGFAL